MSFDILVANDSKLCRFNDPCEARKEDVQKGNKRRKRERKKQVGSLELEIHTSAALYQILLE